MKRPCLYCGHPADTVDHIVPQIAGGGNHPSNLAPACRSCNAAKNARSVEHFLRDAPEILARVISHQAGKDVLAGLLPHDPPGRAADKGWQDYKDSRAPMMVVRMPVALRDRIDAAAKAQGMSRSAYIRGAAIKGLERQGR
jgi:hypothetical protein